MSYECSRMEPARRESHRAVRCDAIQRESLCASINLWAYNKSNIGYHLVSDNIKKNITKLVSVENGKEIHCASDADHPSSASSYSHGTTQGALQKAAHVNGEAFVINKNQLANTAALLTNGSTCARCSDSRAIDGRDTVKLQNADAFSDKDRSWQRRSAREAHVGIGSKEESGSGDSKGLVKSHQLAEVVLKESIIVVQIINKCDIID